MAERMRTNERLSYALMAALMRTHELLMAKLMSHLSSGARPFKDVGRLFSQP